MALTTLANVIQTVDPEAETAEQAALKHLLRRANALIRTRTRRFHGGVIESNNEASPTIIRSYGHGLESGDTIVISGSNCTPTIDGSRVVTVLDQDSFTVPIAVTSAGTAGYYAKQFIEYYDGNNLRELQLRNVPVRSVANVWLDPNGHYGQGADAFNSSTLLVVAQDYDLELSEVGYSATGCLRKLWGVWPGNTDRVGMQAIAVPGNGNIKVQYVSGYRSMPTDLSLAAEVVVADLYRTASDGASMASESIDYYSYTRLSAADEENALSSAKSLLKRFTTPLV